MTFELPKLKYAYSDLEPYIDAKTVEIHYSKHHQAYVTNLNKALEKYPEYSEWTIEKLLTELNNLPEDIATVVRNHGGGYYNHNIYWETMSKTPKQAPTDKLSQAIDQAFGSVMNLKTKMNEAAMTRFGSGWAWLVFNGNELTIYSTPNQDSPLTQGHTPLLGVDVWEHAYYLNYQNRRNDYLEGWWNLVDWEAVEARFNQLA
jgi:Fe-Mn family superoxide dismutase